MAVQKIALTLTVDGGSNNSYWVNTANAFAVDGAEASLVRGSAGSDWYLTCSTNAASVMPAGGTIVGVEIQVTARASITSSTPTILAGPGATTAPANTALTTSLVTYTFGGPSNTLGVSAASGLATVALNTRLGTATSTTFYVDAVVVNMYVDVPAGNAQALTLTVNASGYANSYWTSPADALTANGAYASANPGSGSRTFAYDTNAASAIPANAVILGVVITVKGYATTTANTPLIGAAPSASGIGGAATLQPVTATNAVYTYGASDNPLDALSRADLATLAVRVQNTSGSTSTYYIDHATMTVYWDYPTDGVHCMFFGENF